MVKILEDRIDVANAMITFGGSFVEKLGHALLCADLENVERIRQAFTEYWIEYAALAGAIVKEK